MDINKVFLTIVCLFHILIWMFVMFAFINVNAAKINIYIVIPFIYVLHILPFHVLIEIKKNLSNTWKDYDDKILKNIGFPFYFVELQKKLEKYCFFSPISPQGMLIFGLISSIYSLNFYNK
jgi:hypothetical protein